jgi:hypothetical protein
MGALSAANPPLELGKYTLCTSEPGRDSFNCWTNPALLGLSLTSEIFPDESTVAEANEAFQLPLSLGGLV